MLSSINQKNNTTIKIGYDTAFLSGVIVALNLLLSLYEYNTAALGEFNVSSSDFVIPVLILMLSSAEIFYSYRRCHKQIKMRFAKIFSGCSFAFSAFLLVVPFLLFTQFCCINEDGYLEMIGNLADLFKLSSVPLINNKHFFGIYIISSILQAVASLVKLSINKDLRFSNTSETN